MWRGINLGECTCVWVSYRQSLTAYLEALTHASAYQTSISTSSCRLYISPPYSTSHSDSARMSADPEREHALDGYKSKLLESREWEAKLKALRLEIKGLQHDFDVSEDNIKALQSVGQIIGEVLKQLDEERCMPILPPPSN